MENTHHEDHEDHEHHEHHEHHESHEHHEHPAPVYKEKKSHSMRNKPWVVSTFVLAILVVLLILGNLFHLTGKEVSANQAGEKILNFAVAQGLSATLINVSSEGSFYKVYLSIQNNDIPIYVTKDGKYFTSSLYPLVTEKNSTSSSNSTTQTNNIPKTTKPAVDLFVMSYCPYGTQAEKGILPVVELLGDKIDFNIRFVDYSMHEFSQGTPYEPEMEENLRQYCIQKEQKTKFNDYLTCFLKAGDNATCLTDAKIDKTKLNACMIATDKQFNITGGKNDKTKWLSGTYPPFDIDKELNNMYNVQGSPTLVINGVQVNSARDPASFLDVICQAFTNDSVPSECGQQLSTTSYSAGFGYTTGSTTSGSGTQCG